MGTIPDLTVNDTDNDVLNVLGINPVIAREKDTILFEPFLGGLGTTIEGDGELKVQLLLGHGLNRERQIKRGPIQSDGEWE
jgi:hypothetical protein